MAKHTETLWQIEPHTKVKHEILRKYLGAWFAILGSRIPRIVYIDGFSGPGRYTGGEEGSPIIALKEAIKQPILENSEVVFIFIDERPDRIDHLKSELSAMTIPANFKIEPRVNEFDNTLTNLLDDLENKGSLLAPTFAFIDPFGFKGAPFRVVQRLLKNPRTEVFINLMIDSVNRFAEHPDATDRQHIQELLGASPEEINQVVSSVDRVSGFRQLYQGKLKQKADFVRYFEMIDSRNKPIYYLFFATNHRLGHKKIKEVFWNVDKQSGFRFSDRTDPKQLVLFDEDPSTSVEKLILDRFAGSSILSNDVITFIEDETSYTSKHAKKVLKDLEEKTQLAVGPTKSDGTRRVKGTYPDGVQIQFLKK
jgi:three-Cys-motif partner protein